MFVPPYDVLLRALGTTRESLTSQSKVLIPVPFLKFLLRFAIEECDINEKEYLAANPDVAEAVRKGLLASGRQHFLSAGYFETRRGATPEVDETWYRKMNPDVTAAIARNA